MRAVIQRVLRASVRRAGGDPADANSNSIKDGLLVFLGIHRDDVASDLEWMANKLLNLKVFNDDADNRWKLSVKDLKLEILCISQFTLYGNTTKGNKPDFHHSMAGPESLPMYEEFLARLGKLYDASKVQKGFFGERMLIDSEMDGPVTITLDSPAKASLPSVTKSVKRTEPAEILVSSGPANEPR